MAVKNSTSPVTEDNRKYIWAMQPPQEMLFFPATRISSSLGTTVHEPRAPSTDRLTRKKYVGVRSLELQVMAAIMRELPQSTMA